MLDLPARSAARPQSYDDLGFREFGALLNSKPTDAAGEQSPPASDAADYYRKEEVPAADNHVAEASESDVSHAHPAVDPSVTEASPESAAERIDAWFRSAKTLAEIPPVPNADVEDANTREPLAGTSRAAANYATVEIGSGGIEELNADFDLDQDDERPDDLAAWDDTQRMDQLLADLDSKSHAEAAQAEDQPASAEEQRQTDAGQSWAAGDVFTIVPKAERPRRKRSVVRSLVMTVVGGVMGLAAGYYALLWIRGPEIDFLEVAKYLPKAVLPPSFKANSQPTAGSAPLQAKNEHAATESGESSATATDTGATVDAQAAPAVPAAAPSAEQLATFNEPLDITKLAEPAPLNAPSGAPLKGSMDIGEPIHIAGLPSFNVAELSAALEAGKKAEPGLLAGSFGDSDETNRTKGLSYLTLADLAQKTTFVDDPTSSEAKALQQQSEEIFRRILTDTHARNEIGQIVLKWISSPNRKDRGGVFFAGNVLKCEARGPVSECSVSLPDGQTLQVLTPTSVADGVKTSNAPVAVVGWIVNDPAKNVTGYTGSASQAIFSPRLISLE